MSGPADGAPLPFTAKTQTVLVVEDDDDARATLAAMVTELGYRVVEAENGASALPILEQERPVNILLSDVIMPGGMSGVDLAKAARKRRPDIRVLFVSGYDRMVIAQATRYDDSLKLLNKPFSLTDLARELQALLPNERG
ncbi:MAG: response regulator [Alphaproteobacteria bacterium]|nr:response regulator [Alphaproteobacteria bacterium]